MKQKYIVDSFTTTKALKRKTARRAKSLFGCKGKSKYIRGLIERDFAKGTSK